MVKEIEKRLNIKLRSLIYILIIVVATFVVYSNTFQVPFHFDDDSNISGNPLIKDMGYLIEPSQYCSRITPLSQMNHLCKFFKLRYVGYVTFAVNYGLQGLNVTGYHIVNLLIHSVNGLLVFLLIILTFKTPFLRDAESGDYSEVIALFTALLFVVHPLQTQAVTYIVQRFTSLATLFYILSLVLYIGWRLKQSDMLNRAQSGQEKQKCFYWKNLLLYFAAVLCAVLAMKTKEIAFTLPFIIIIYEFLFFNDSRTRKVLYVIPFLLTMLIIPLSLIDVDKPFENLLSDVSNETRLQTGISRWEYLLTEFRIIMTYLRLIILPVNQNLDYDYTIYHSFFNPEVFLSFFFLLALGLSSIYLLYRYRNTAPQARLISFGIFWFYITLSVESSVIPIADIIFEHRVYLPSVGMFLSISTSVFWAVYTCRKKGKMIERAVIIAFTCIIIVFAGAAYKRNMVWQNHISLWQDVVDKSPNKGRGYYNLGRAYQDNKMYDKAIEPYNKVIALDPTNIKAYNNMANMYLIMKDYDKALNYYTIAITINPESDILYYNRGRLYFIANEYDKAIEDFTKAITINPNLLMYYKKRGQAYAWKKQYRYSIHDFTSALHINPNDPEIYELRGLSYSLLGDAINAFPDFQKSCGMGYRQACDALRQYNR
jgi:protein O-mannosyl-transferase